VDATRLPSSFIEELKQVLGSFPGESDVVLEMSTVDGLRRLRLGPEFRVSSTPTLHAELQHVLGSAAPGATAAAAG
jgi:hypothetical protein